MNEDDLSSVVEAQREGCTRAVPRQRSWRNLLDTDFDEPFLATRVLTRYALPMNPNTHYIVDRVASITSHQVVDNLRESALSFWQRVLSNADQLVPNVGLNPYYLLKIHSIAC